MGGITCEQKINECSAIRLGQEARRPHRGLKIRELKRAIDTVMQAFIEEGKDDCTICRTNSMFVASTVDSATSVPAHGSEEMGLPDAQKIREEAGQEEVRNRVLGGVECVTVRIIKFKIRA